MLKKFLEAGRITGTRGLDGELRIEPWCNGPQFLTGFGRLFFNEGADCRRVVSARAYKSAVFLKLEGVERLEDAIALVGRVLYIDRGDVTLPQGSYFEQDLIGLTVIDADTGEEYGKIASVGKTGANDYYTVRRPGGGEVLIPAIRQVIKEIDPTGGVLRITPLKGLFDDEN